MISALKLMWRGDPFIILIVMVGFSFASSSLWPSLLTLALLILFASLPKSKTP